MSERSLPTGAGIPGGDRSGQARAAGRRGGIALRPIVGPASPPPIAVRPSIAAGLTILATAGFGIVNLLAVSSGVDLVGLVVIPLAAVALLLRTVPAIFGLLAITATTVATLAIPNSGEAVEVAALFEFAVSVVVAIALRAVVAIAADAAARQRRRETDLTSRMTALLGLTRRFGQTLDREALLQLIVAEAARNLQADAVTIRVIRGDHLEIAAWSGLPDPVGAMLPTFPLDDPWFEPVIRTRRAVARRDVLDNPELRPARDRLAEWVDVRGNLMAPLLLDDRVIGTLAAFTFEPRDWSSTDLQFVAGLAAHGAVALSTAELYERAQARARQFSVLRAASVRMTRARTQGEVGRAVVEELRQIVDYHNARVYVIEPPDRVVPIACEGDLGLPEPVDWDLVACRIGEGLSGWVAETGEPILTPDAATDPRAAQIEGTDDIDESMLVVPMRNDEEIVGVISLSELGLDRFSTDDLQVLTILAGQAATALASVARLRRSENLAAELRRLLAMSTDLAASLDSREVAQLSARHLAESLGVEACTIGTWNRPTDQLTRLAAFPLDTPEDGAGSIVELAADPDRLAVLETSTPALVAAGRAGSRTLALPLVAKGRSIGLVELVAGEGTVDESRLDLAQTMANEAAMALENALLYEDARALADRDPLTGFYNHRFLHERLAEEILRARRARRPLSLLMLDVDDFKLVNDSFGHLFGDRVLTWTAGRIRAALRATDIAARYGGDEFAILLPETGAPAARRVARRILEHVSVETLEADSGRAMPVSISIGVATFPDDGGAPAELLVAADRRLYIVKDRGGHGEAASDGPADATGRGGIDDGDAAIGPGSEAVA